MASFHNRNNDINVITEKKCRSYYVFCLILDPPSASDPREDNETEMSERKSNNNSHINANSDVEAASPLAEPQQQQDSPNQD